MSRAYDTIPTPEEVQTDLDWAAAEGNGDEVKVLRHLLKAAHCKATLAAEAKARGLRAEALLAGEARRASPYSSR